MYMIKDITKEIFGEDIANDMFGNRFSAERIKDAIKTSQKETKRYSMFDVQYDLKDDKQQIIIPMPGVDKSQIEVSVKEMKIHVKSQKGIYGHCYDLNFTIDNNLDTDDMTVKFENGILMMDIPIIKPKMKVIKIL